MHEQATDANGIDGVDAPIGGVLNVDQALDQDGVACMVRRRRSLGFGGASNITRDFK